MGIAQRVIAQEGAGAIARRVIVWGQLSGGQLAQVGIFRGAIVRGAVIQGSIVLFQAQLYRVVRNLNTYCPRIHLRMAFVQV